MARSSTHQKERAFTLIELIIVIVVLGILSTIAIVGYQTVVNKSTEAKQVSRMTQVLKEAKVLYVQNIYSDPTYTWAQAVASAIDDLPTYTTNALSYGAQAQGASNQNTATNGWTAQIDVLPTDAIYSASPNDIVMYTSPAGTVYVASAISSGKGVFGMVSQTMAPFVWLAGCAGSTCDAATASSGPPAGGSYASGTTAVTTTGPTTTVALTCAAGGVCVVGNTGPGGGIVFYVQAAGGTFPCGATLTAPCKYLEAAPTSGTLAWTDATYVWSGNTTTGIGAGAQGTAVGTGLKNTLAMVAQDNTAGRAGTITRAYRGPNNLSDWYLPSKDELNQMCKWQGGQSWVSDATYCADGGSMNTGPGASGFFWDQYWSSSEFNPTGAWFWFLGFEYHSGHAKSTTHYVRPVRAF